MGKHITVSFGADRKPVYSTKHQSYIRTFHRPTGTEEKQTGVEPIPEKKSKHKPSGRYNIDVVFAEELRDRPEVYQLVDQFTWKLIKAGFTKYSMDAIFHHMRWHEHVDKGNADFKLNDILTSRYARFWMKNNPDYAGFFETRVLKS